MYQNNSEIFEDVSTVGGLGVHFFSLFNLVGFNLWG
jgi:hypothetical protein